MMHADEMNITESKFKNIDGEEIYCRYWKKSDENYRALVFIAHGFGEHCQRYDSFVKTLVDDGCLVFSHDHAGHGRSTGPRVHINSLYQYTRDIVHHIKSMASEEYPNLPVFIYGHSMGGLLALSAGIELPGRVRGMILTAPCLQLARPSWIPLSAGRAFAYFFPECQAVSFDNSGMCRDEKTIEEFMTDPLCWHGGIKAKFGCSLMDGMAAARASYRLVNWPLLVMHGSADVCTNPDGSRQLIAECSSLDKTLKIYEGFYHRLISEPGEDGERARADIYTWIKSRI